MHCESSLTELHQHLVAFVDHKVFDVLEVEVLGADERQYAAGRADDDVRAVGAQRLLVLLHVHAAEEHRDLDAVHVLGEALVLLADLERQLACVAHHEHRHLTTPAHAPARHDLSTQRLHWGGSVAEWLVCGIQAQNGPGSYRSCDAVG